MIFNLTFIPRFQLQVLMFQLLLLSLKIKLFKLIKFVCPDWMKVKICNKKFHNISCEMFDLNSFTNVDYKVNKNQWAVFFFFFLFIFMTKGIRINSIFNNFFFYVLLISHLGQFFLFFIFLCIGVNPFSL